ncbi:MAG: (E)-4-hydroxy-3-methylbut-2-enyl-diphosphate synthase [Opitutales bacterium]|nr:(E)-4-hydroxy-3-methylbut-2-enyl-diphosphate synthase [Opitutales bacterium]
MSGIPAFPDSYSRSRLVALRRATRVVNIGAVKVGGGNAIAVQSMTNTLTTDVKATLAQSIALAEAGCQIVRITAPNVQAAKALGDIRREFSAAGFANVPLVADIHFLPAAAMEAALHVEKIRINPGNYADRKLPEARDYTEAEYAAELERLHEAVTPLVTRCKELGRAIRVGVNHGSLSDRIMNRYGDTPAGMCESALEFLRICEAHNFHDIVVSLKASNPKVMIQASRLIAARMDAEGLNYPLHLGVTEAGGGEDARVKSALGIGTILRDGLGDTIRVSLTEDPVEEVPVAIALAREAEALWAEAEQHAEIAAKRPAIRLNPYIYERRESVELSLGEGNLPIGGKALPRVALVTDGEEGTLSRRLALWNVRNPKMRAEIALAPASGELPKAKEQFAAIVREAPPFAELRRALDAMNAAEAPFVVDATPAELTAILPVLKKEDAPKLIFTCTRPQAPLHPAGEYRLIAQMLAEAGIASPIWVRHTQALMDSVRKGLPADDTARMMDAAVVIGGLLCEGIGDIVSVETAATPERSLETAYGILQGSRTRSTRTEYVACPSCGRTLFDLESTTKRVRAATGHLEGVTIAVMGCIVNGPGEMADADFGYVGGAPGKINLYVGKKPVQINIPSSEAVEHLVALIKEHGKWQEAPSATEAS